MRSVTLITGASAGIGTALAHVFAEHGHELVLIARREQRLAELADAIAARGHRRPIVLPVDLAAPDATDRIGDVLALLDVEPEIVVNNAGFGLVGAAADLDQAFVGDAISPGHRVVGATAGGEHQRLPAHASDFP